MATKKKKKKKKYATTAHRIAALEGRVLAKIMAVDHQRNDDVRKLSVLIQNARIDAQTDAVLRRVDVLERKAVDAYKRLSAIEQARIADPAKPHVISTATEAHGLPVGTVVFNAERMRMVRSASGWDGEGPSGAFSGLTDEYAVGWTIERLGAGGVYVEAEELGLLRALEAAVHTQSADAVNEARMDLQWYRKRVRI